MSSRRSKKPGEHLERLRCDVLKAEAEQLRSRAFRWATDVGEAMRQADPEIPNSLDDRAADNWRSLLAIADQAGGPWPERARKVAKALSAGRDEGEGSWGVRLLSDLQSLFEERRSDRLPTSTILEALEGMEDRSWPEANRGKPITSQTLARLLKPFGIRPKTVRFADGSMAKGYYVTDMEEAFARYLPQKSVTASHADSATTYDVTNVTCDAVTDNSETVGANTEETRRPEALHEAEGCNTKLDDAVDKAVGLLGGERLPAEAADWVDGPPPNPTVDTILDEAEARYTQVRELRRRSDGLGPDGR